jgi:opacity protein-like surface antigen
MFRRTRIRWILALLGAATLPCGAQNLGPSSTPTVGPTAEGLYIAPKNGQSSKQMWADRYACSRWAKSQSGFDPTDRSSAATADSAAHRDQYRRAMAACLEAHGYTVSYGAPPVAPPPPQALPPAQPIYVQQRPPAPAGIRYHPLRVQIDGGYSVAAGSAARALDDGWNGGLGLTWFPSSVLPLGVRVDTSYSRFGASGESLAAASESLGTPLSFGHENIYGGDLDAEIDLPLGPTAREYFFGGAGQYREQTVYEQIYAPGRCFFFCGGYVATAEQTTSRWLNSWNAGVGFEFEVADPATFFIEARYLSIGHANGRQAFVPIQMGIRF